ncbi:MAG: thioredoxin family protein [Candidatus Moranbacteria bacterium]|nr:thioredoxin family protein [Candidatus Moranbacteria bacterium]
MPAKVIDFADASFPERAIEVFKNEILVPFQEKLVILFPYALWCGPCRQMLDNVLPLVVEEANENVILCRMQIDAGVIGNDAIVSLIYKVRAIPSLLFFKRQEIINWITGGVSVNTIMKDINKYQ